MPICIFVCQEVKYLGVVIHSTVKTTIDDTNYRIYYYRIANYNKIYIFSVSVQDFTYFRRLI